MDLITQLALGAGLAWASGIRLYATVFVVGMLARLHYVVLPADLAVLDSDWVLWTSAVLVVGEFVADKVPAFDSVWDGLHTFIRIPAGALLAWGALGDQGPAIQFAAALAGGMIVSGTHLTKAGARLAINHSPEPFSNWATSLGEDGLVLAGLWLMFQHPVAFLLALAVFVALMIWLLPRMWRLLRGSWQRLRGLPRASVARA